MPAHTSLPTIAAPGQAGLSAHRSVGGYREYRPTAAQSAWLEAPWIHAAPDDERLRTEHRVVTDPAPSLAFECVRDADGRPGGGRLLLIGPVRRPRIYRPRPGHRLEGLRVKPEWCRRLLGADPADHADALDDYVPIDGSFARALLDRLGRTRSSEEGVAVLAAAVQERAEAAAGSPQAVDRALSILRGGRTTRIREIARALEITPRHLRRVVVCQTGVSPRRFARHQRFLRLVAAVDGLEAPRWNELAVEHGFADQPHLIRESRRLAGVTPTVLHEERRAEVPWP